MKFKKIIVLLTTVCMLGGLVACGGDDNTNVNTNDDQTITEDNSDSDKKEENNNSGSYDEITEEVVRNHAVTDVSEFEYSPDVDSGNEGVIIYNYKGTDTIVVIPEEIDGKPVTSLGMVFANDSTVQGVFIPSSVKRLGSTFGNNKCVEVVIAEGAEYLEKTFLNCSKLHTLILSECVTTIDASTFSGLPELDSLYIPETLVEIPKFTFTSVAGMNENFTVKGKSGSYIETYCTENNIKFEAVN